jgi:hypothetical protein
MSPRASAQGSRMRGPGCRVARRGSLENVTPARRIARRTTIEFIAAQQANHWGWGTCGRAPSQWRPGPCLRSRLRWGQGGQSKASAECRDSESERVRLRAAGSASSHAEAQGGWPRCGAGPVRFVRLRCCRPSLGVSGRRLLGLGGWRMCFGLRRPRWSPGPPVGRRPRRTRGLGLRPPLRLAAVAHALSVMFDIDFLILLLLSGMAVVVQRDMQEPRSTPRGVGQKQIKRPAISDDAASCKFKYRH